MGYLRTLPRGHRGGNNKHKNSKKIQKPRAKPRPFTVCVTIQSVPHTKSRYAESQMPIGIRKTSEEVTVYGLLHAGEKQFNYRMRFARIGLIEQAKELKVGDKISVTGTFRVDNPKKSRLQELRVQSFTLVESKIEITDDKQILQIEGEINP